MESIRTSGADAVATAEQRLAPQGVAGGASPALVTEAEAIHAVAVSAAVCRLAAPRVDAQDGGDAASTAPPAVRVTAQRKKSGEKAAGKSCSWLSEGSADQWSEGKLANEPPTTKVDEPPPSRLMALMTPFFFRKAATSQRFILSRDKQKPGDTSDFPSLRTRLSSFTSFARWISSRKRVHVSHPRFLVCPSM